MVATSNLKSEGSSSFDKRLVEINALNTSAPKKALEQLEEFESSEIALEKASDPIAIFELNLLKGKCLFQLNKLDVAEAQFYFCLEHSENHNNTLQTIKALNNIAQLEFRQNKLQQVLITSTKALTLSKETNVFTEQAVAHNIMGVAYGALYSYENSLDSLLAGLELKEYLCKDLMYKLNNNTSNVYFFLGNYELALDTLKTAIYHVDINENPRIHILSEMNFGKIHTKLENIDCAMKHLQTATTEVEKNPEHVDLLTALHQNYANLYTQQGLFDEAITSFHKAIALTQEEDNSGYQANLSVALAKCYIRQKKYDLGLETLNIASDLNEQSSIATTRLNIHEGYSEIYEQLGDYKTSLEHFKHYHNLKEEVQDERSKARLQGLMIKNDTERIQDEHKRIATEKELASLRLLRLEQDNKKLVEENNKDGLTGAYNRRFLNAHLEQSFNFAKENQSPLNVMMSDIDFFKQVNDTFSHAIGDKVLRIIAQIFMGNTRQHDIIARYGGEEFVGIFDNTPKGTAITIAEKLRSLVEEYPWHTIHPDLKITISVGIVHGTDYPDYEAMLNHADQCMYTAKRSGKNQVQYE